MPSHAAADEDEPITLKVYAQMTGRSLRSVQMDVKNKRIPAWKDPTIPRTRVTSLGAIRRLKEATAAKAEREFFQKAKLT